MMLGGDGDLMSIVRSCGSTTSEPVTPPSSLPSLMSGTTAFFQSSALTTWSTTSFLPPDSLATEMMGTVGGDRFMSGTEAFFHSSISVSNVSVVGPTASTVPAEPAKKQQPRQRKPRAAAVAAPSRKRKEEEEERVVVTAAGSPVPGDDEFRWRKYGEKFLKGSHISRSYYKCRNRDDSAGCPAKKVVDTRDDEPGKCTITYIGDHNHKPLSSVLAITPGKKVKIEVDDDYPYSCSPISVLNTDELSPGTTPVTVLWRSTVKEEEEVEIDGPSPVMPLLACPSTVKEEEETQEKPERMLTVDDIVENAGDDNMMFLGQSFASKDDSFATWMEVAAKDVDSAAKDVDSAAKECFPSNDESSSTWAWLEEMEKRRLWDDDEEKVTTFFSDLFQLQDDFSWCL